MGRSACATSRPTGDIEGALDDREVGGCPGTRVHDVRQFQIVELRKHLVHEGLDGGAHTIAVHLQRRHGGSPAPSTIWRVLSRRGFVTPQPQKRPRSSFVRFEAAMPNERWQADFTHWRLADGTDVEILISGP